MFSVYGVTGMTFRGPLEELGAVAGLAAARHARGIAREGEEFGPELARLRGEGHAAPDQAATAEYRRMLGREDSREPILHAAQVMSRDVLTLAPTLPVERAWEVLVRAGYGQAPVVSPAGRVVGLVTVLDMLTVINVEQGVVRDSLPRGVEAVMTSPVLSADPVSDVRRVARVLLEYDLPGLPVIDRADRLVGIVTRGDLLRALSHDPPLSLWG
ncbi:MAG: HPP family protein [Pseudomonadota bacterium]